MISLHCDPGNASMAPHVLLRERDAPFELELIDRAEGAHKSPVYLKLTPSGLVPVLRGGDLVLHEAAAIVPHLAGTYPRAALDSALASHGDPWPGSYRQRMLERPAAQRAFAAGHLSQRWL
ncbi:glutathione S-transferase N-terminal domain-containing protein [Ideonella sp. A 288]|uniref:glutathione S-transferase N-terminal domain-containing protein n=1 Tax=Ideonella sp. A 288 TaxID=1962181 RepID=UPI001F1CAB12|nr:glutathione S-transferase N-terminal domain-containing protein [Ideonella sp. A 288]